MLYNEKVRYTWVKFTEGDYDNILAIDRNKKGIERIARFILNNGKCNSNVNYVLKKSGRGDRQPLFIMTFEQ